MKKSDSLNTSKKYDGKIQHLFRLDKLHTEGMYLNVIDAIYDKPTANNHTLL